MNALKINARVVCARQNYLRQYNRRISMLDNANEDEKSLQLNELTAEDCKDFIGRGIVCKE